MIQEFTLNFNFYEKLSLDVQTDGDCYYYENTQVFNIRERSIFRVSIQTARRTCIESFAPKDRQLWFLVLVGLMAIV